MELGHFDKRLPTTQKKKSPSGFLPGNYTAKVDDFSQGTFSPD